MAQANMATLEKVKSDAVVKMYMKKADDFLGILGYTEHGQRHATLVMNIAINLLKRLEISERDTELAGIAAYLHDIGNVINREFHAQSAALLSHSILTKIGLPDEDVADIIAAIGNHHETDGNPISNIAAAVILGDKSDVHRSRVRNPAMIKFDIHDRVNYASTASFLRVIPEKKVISLEVTIDTEISQVMEYFEIFLSRMIISRRAAAFLSCAFELVINGNKLM